VDVDEEMEEGSLWELYGAVVAEVAVRVHETQDEVVEAAMQIVSLLMVSTPLTRRGHLLVPSGINLVMLAVHM
jgi:hypothetical protein